MEQLHVFFKNKRLRRIPHGFDNVKKETSLLRVCSVLNNINNTTYFEFFHKSLLHSFLKFNYICVCIVC